MGFKYKKCETCGHEFLVQTEEQVDLQVGDNGACTVRPKDPVTESIADINISGDIISILLPEKNEDFRKVVKYKLQYSWDGEKWARRINSIAGEVGDRVAELGHTLLCEKFIISLENDELRRRAIEGDYKPEQKKWIAQVTSGKHHGWFALVWPRGEDLYKQARRITGSKYERPNVVVPAEHFEEVLDFAEIHKFKFTDSALELVNKAQEEKKSSLVVNIEMKKEDQVFTRMRPEKVEIPDNVSVSEDLKEA